MYRFEGFNIRLARALAETQDARAMLANLSGKNRRLDVLGFEVIGELHAANVA